MEGKNYRNNVRLAISQLAKTIQLLQSTHGLSSPDVFRIIMTAWRDAGDREVSIRLAWMIKEIEMDAVNRELNQHNRSDRKKTRKPKPN